jgi:hypothetical protein
MVRSAGNDRALGANANDDGYPSDPRVIAVAAVNINGRAADYSDPGACVLVSARAATPPRRRTACSPPICLEVTAQMRSCFSRRYVDLSDYNFYNQFTGTEGFTGTTLRPRRTCWHRGLDAGANPSLNYRDVQQILVLASRHVDFADPDLTTNGAGFRVSHNVGFGVPDAGVAVSLARSWTNRPPLTNVTSLPMIHSQFLMMGCACS